MSKNKIIDLHNVKAVLDNKTNTIRIISKDPIFRKEGFKINIKPGSIEDTSIRNAMNIGKYSNYEISRLMKFHRLEKNKTKGQINLGLGIDNKNYYWKIDNENTSPFVHVTGMTGIGKSIFINTFIENLKNNKNQYKYFDFHKDDIDYITEALFNFVRSNVVGQHDKTKFLILDSLPHYSHLSEEFRELLTMDYRILKSFNKTIILSSQTFDYVELFPSSREVAFYNSPNINKFFTQHNIEHINDKTGVAFVKNGAHTNIIKAYFTDYKHTQK